MWSKLPCLGRSSMMICESTCAQPLSLSHIHLLWFSKVAHLLRQVISNEDFSRVARRPLKLWRVVLTAYHTVANVSAIVHQTPCRQWRTLLYRLIHPNSSHLRVLRLITNQSILLKNMKGSRSLQLMEGRMHGCSFLPASCSRV